MSRVFSHSSEYPRRKRFLRKKGRFSLMKASAAVTVSPGLGFIGLSIARGD